MSNKYAAEVSQQLKKTKNVLKPNKTVFEGLSQFHALLEICFKYMEFHMDKKIKSLKNKIDKGMDKLVKEDIPRDKKIEKCDKIMKKKKK